MAREDAPKVAVEVDRPQVSLVGTVCDEMIPQLVEGLKEAEKGKGPVTIEMSTLGGDPEAARRMILEVELARERLKPRRLLFLGKTSVYSAGATFMAGFPRGDRYLTKDATLLIHCRQLEKTIELSGPMRASRAKLEAQLHEIDTGVDLEVENFERLIEGSEVTMDELLEKALYNWYVPAKEAVERGLVAGLV
jgi:ATP-dependent protease ClpP protease subunit